MKTISIKNMAQGAHSIEDTEIHRIYGWKEYNGI